MGVNLREIMFCGMSLLDMCFYFAFWSTFGWAIEVVDRTLETGGFENRGFLNGPFCPIYGFGVLGIRILLLPIRRILILYILIVILCSALELGVGMLLQKLFNAKWWDYSDKKFNYRGFICLKISLLWGAGGLLVLRVVQPALEMAVPHIPYTAGIIIISTIAVVVIADTVCSVCEVCNFNNRLQQISKLMDVIHDKSITLGENISEETLEIKSKYDKLVEQTKNSRIVKAFPQMKSETYNEALKALKEKISNGKDIFKRNKS